MSTHKPKQVGLEEEWCNQNVVNSWCAIDSWTISSNINKLDRSRQIVRKRLYGLLNYCFRLEFDGDQILHGLPMANVTAFSSSGNVRNPTFDFRIQGPQSVRLSRNFAKTIQFVSLLNVHSTKLAVSALDEHKEPCNPGDRAVYLNFLHLHPERRCYNTVYYESSDTQHMKEFETYYHHQC